MDYPDYEHLTLEKNHCGVLRITMDRPPVNAMNPRMHFELTEIWRTADRDPDVRAILVTGAGRAFSAGGDVELEEEAAQDLDARLRTMREALDLVYGMVNLDKPIVSAINGAAVGAGLAVALLADISIASQTARLSDGHTRMAVAAGDHAALIWPLLCGMAKAKYYLLTSEFIDGTEAERIGLVSMCVEPDALIDTAQGVANNLANSSAFAVRFTKRTLNHWLRVAAPIFENSLAYEVLNFGSADMQEALAAFKEKRSPRFPANR